MTSDDVDNAIDAWLDETGRDLDPDEIIDDLLDAGLLIDAKDVGAGYRTRIAESLRLLVNLRQIWRPRGDQAT